MNGLKENFCSFCTQESDSELHPAQLAAHKRRQQQREVEDRQRVSFQAYRKKPSAEATVGSAPLTSTASEVDKENNEKVI